MALLKPIALLGLALATLTSAHFVITLPPPLSDNINNEGSSPCGGSTLSAADNLTDFHVGGDAVSLTTLHPQSFFAFRGQVGTSLAPANWSDVIPTVEQYGLNSFCEPALAVPAAWAGSPGLLQVVQDSEDGVHYQCIHVNFVAGTGSTKCSNSSGVSANFAADPVLSSAFGATATAQSTATASPSSAAAKSAGFLSVKTPRLWDRVLLAGLLVFGLAV